MSRRFFAMAFISTIALLGTTPARAATKNAASASAGDVQAAINSAATGDVVLIPAGNATWSSSVSIPTSKSITLKGAGVGATVIRRNSIGLAIAMNNSSSRITGIEFVEGYIQAHGVNWRIDHCKFSSAGFNDGVFTYGLDVGQHPIGVIDHNTFVNTRIVVFGGPVDNMSWGNAIWAQPLGLGTNNAVFAEDNLFDTTINEMINSIDSNSAGRYVFRYNTVYDRHLEAHSIQGDHRAARSWEVYNNVFTQRNATMWIPMRFRGGTGVVFNNTINGTYSWLAFPLDNVRSCYDRGSGGLADGTSPWDGNTPGQSGYPARDQIGRSTDQFLWTSTNPYPPQALEPAYCWNNKRGSTNVVFEQFGCDLSVAHIQAGRDYFNNTQKPGYAPYAYPHPLIAQWDAQGGPTAPKPPSGLRVLN